MQCIYYLLKAKIVIILVIVKGDSKILPTYPKVLPLFPKSTPIYPKVLSIYPKVLSKKYMPKYSQYNIK